MPRHGTVASTACRRRQQLDAPLPVGRRRSRRLRPNRCRPGPLGLWADTWRRLRRNKLALVGLAIIIVFMLVGLSQIIASLAHVGS